MKIQLIRNATVKIEFGGKTWLVDPFLGDMNSLPPFAGKSANPIVPLPDSIPEILNGVDYILVTHLHPDHFDQKAQQEISQSTPLLVQPVDAENLRNMGFRKVEVIETKKRFGDITISRVMAQHGEGEILKVMGKVSGYVLEAAGEKPLYLTGDTIWCDGVKDTAHRFNPGVIVCNAGGNIFFPESNPFSKYISLERVHKVIMDEQQVLELMNYCKDAAVVTVHIGALDHETVSRESMKAYLEKNLMNVNLVHIPEDGETIYL